MARTTLYIIAALLACGCAQDRQDDAPPYDVDFEIPRGEAFPSSLSAYALFRAPLSALRPADGVLLYELSSELFTDYAHKLRLMKLPEGGSITMDGDRLSYPEGTVLAKTFYYLADERDPEAGRRIIETRLLVKTGGQWSVATYLWNAEQTDATLLLDGTTTDVSWIDAGGQTRGTEYAVPHEGECVTCHQSDGETAYIGPSLRNLNRAVVRGGDPVEQLAHLAGEGVLDALDPTTAPAIPDYRDAGQPLESRARAYLDTNCAHCHHPEAWDVATERELDFRYGTPLGETGIARKKDDMVRVVENGKMPYLGTTLPHGDGIRLVVDYLETL